MRQRTKRREVTDSRASITESAVGADAQRTAWGSRRRHKLGRVTRPSRTRRKQGVQAATGIRQVHAGCRRSYTRVSAALARLAVVGGWPPLALLVTATVCASADNRRDEGPRGRGANARRTRASPRSLQRRDARALCAGIAVEPGGAGSQHSSARSAERARHASRRGTRSRSRDTMFAAAQRQLALSAARDLRTRGTSIHSQSCSAPNRSRRRRGARRPERAARPGQGHRSPARAFRAMLCKRRPRGSPRARRSSRASSPTRARRRRRSKRRGTLALRIVAGLAAPAAAERAQISEALRSQATAASDQSDELSAQHRRTDRAARSVPATARR